MRSEIEKSALAGSAHLVLVRHGTQMLQKFIATIDQPAFTAKLAARKGAVANTERLRLRNDPDVRDYIALELPATLAGTGYSVLENLDRIILILRIKLVRRLIPTALEINRCPWAGGD